MQYYEIICILNVNKKNKILNILNKCKKIIINYNGKIYRIENWGKRILSYKIKNFSEAFYICLNIKINKNKIIKIENFLKFNSIVLRYLIIKIKNIPLSKSFFIKNLEKKKKIKNN
ncbi:30S ribosomal protein S6 [Candidatus Zinderia endosymbiont of Aphrophora alni]|uniref:30S ribosomal protein S6 n=1 Tax=Candidatus Zinderia endosymbiont of Aphrophora alni TaxID=3077951 RepID=UPI0030D188AE